MGTEKIDLETILDNSFDFGRIIYLDEIVKDNNGTTDCSTEINAAIRQYSGTGVTLIGNPKSKYLIRDTIDLSGAYNLELNFNYATLLDDVQGTLSTSGGRGKHTFLIYNACDIKIKKINYAVTPTRSNPYLSGIPTIVFWVGGQYLGSAMTSNVVIEDFYADGQSLDKGMVVSGVGELNGIVLRRFNIKNGNWRFGCNFEYGLRPENLEDNLTLTNGRHPYNIYVENFNGENLPECTGFLRTASCYNVKFFSCTGFNVPNFIDYYSGDRGISRYSQNVIFELCKSKLDETIIKAQYAVNVVVTSKDGSTGEKLEEWVNRDHQIKFLNCEFIGNYVQNSTGVRIVGNAGKTIFEGCTIQHYYFGAWSQWFDNTNPNLDSPYALVFRDCIFKKNKCDVRQIDVSGVLYDHCTFKQKVFDNSVPYQVGIWKVLGTCSGTLFRHCYFSEQTTDAHFMRIESESISLEGNEFRLYNPLYNAISNTVMIKGRNNIVNGKLTGDEESTPRIIGDIRKIKVFNDLGDNDTVDFNSSDIWLINSSQKIAQIINGEIGDQVEFRAGISTSNVLFMHNNTNAKISTRLINKSGVDDDLNGLTFSRRYMKFSDGWREM